MKPGDRREGDDARGIASLYDRWAETYDTDANRTRDLASTVMRSELSLNAVGDVLELGCGTGRNTVRLAERARRVVALDFSPRMLEVARSRVAGGPVRFIRHDIRSALPLATASVDLTVVMLVLEHVPQVAPVLEECARVLRPGGRLFVCELHPHRQWAGVRARFTPAGARERVEVPAFVHEASEHVNAGLEAGLILSRMGEWRDEEDEAEGARARLLSLLFASGGGGRATRGNGGVGTTGAR